MCTWPIYAVTTLCSQLHSLSFCLTFGFNFGRILAAVGSLQLGNLVAYFAGGLTIGPWKLAGGYPAACTLLSLIYVLGLVIIWFAPETKGKPLPD